MSVILWILQAYGSYRIGWQLQLLDPDPGLCDTLQSKYCKWLQFNSFYVFIAVRNRYGRSE